MSAEVPAVARRRRTRGRSGQPGQKAAVGFYAEALSEAERGGFVAADETEGGDDELALLRRRLAKAIGESPEDMELMLKGSTTLVGVVAARFKLSPGSIEELTRSVRGVLSEYERLAGEVET